MIGVALALVTALKPEPVPVNFIVVGHDVLSNTFYQAIEDVMLADKRLRWPHRDEQARWTLYSETNVRPLESGSGHFAYKVSLRRGSSTNGEVIERFDGACVVVAKLCAEEVVARMVARIRR